MPRCSTCGKSFNSEASLNGHKVAHSEKYREGIEGRDLTGENNPAYSGGKISLECKNCGQEFKVTPARRSSANFCTQDCSSEWKSDNYKKRNFGDRLPVLEGEDNPNYGRDFSGKNSPKWKDFPKKDCVKCDKTFKVKPSREDIARFCSEECQNKWMSDEWKRRGMGERLPVMKGEDNPKWVGGYDSYYGLNWHQQKRKALERDDYMCQKCGKTKEDLGRNPDVHHIKPIRTYRHNEKLSLEDGNNIENLVVLCRSCHGKIENLPVAPQFG